MTTNITNDSYIAHAVDAVTQSYAHCLRIVDREIDKDNGTVESVKFVAMFIFRKNEDGKLYPRTITFNAVEHTRPLADYAQSAALCVKEHFEKADQPLFIKEIKVITTYKSTKGSEPTTTRMTQTMNVINWCAYEKCQNYETTARKIDVACNQGKKYCSMECLNQDTLNQKKVSRKAA
jgi:hypothetical protein